MEKPDRDVDINRAYIPVVNEKVSKGAVNDYYNTVKNSDGKVDNVMAVHSLNPASGNAHNAIYTQAMQGPSSLSEAEREAVGLAVSYINSCRYIINRSWFLLRMNYIYKSPFLVSTFYWYLQVLTVTSCSRSPTLSSQSGLGFIYCISCN